MEVRHEEVRRHAGRHSFAPACHEIDIVHDPALQHKAALRKVQVDRDPAGQAEIAGVDMRQQTRQALAQACLLVVHVTSGKS